MKIELITPEHDCTRFRCRYPKLDSYLKRLALESTQKGYGRTYVAVAEGEPRVWGYYTISSSSVPLSIFPGLENAPGNIPVILLGRLAVDKKVQAQRLGTKLMVHAFKQALLSADATGVYAMEVEASDENARSYYERFDFKPLLDNSRHMFLPIETIRASFGNEEAGK